MSENVRYRMRVYAVPACIALYFLIAALPALLRAGDERYLLFHWFVFSEVPSHEQTSYIALVHMKSGVPLEVPERIEDAGVLRFDTRRNAPYYASRIILLGRWLEYEPDRAQPVRDEIESLMLEKPLEYSIVKITYDPIQRVLHGTVNASSTIARYTVQ